MLPMPAAMLQEVGDGLHAAGGGATEGRQRCYHRLVTVLPLMGYGDVWRGGGAANRSRRAVGKVTRRSFFARLGDGAVVRAGNARLRVEVFFRCFFLRLEYTKR